MPAESKAAAMIGKLGLGTVQFGIPYGIANNAGQTKHDEAAAILAAARAQGIDTLDTAVNYGESESVLGAIGIRDWNVVTKLPALPEGQEEVERWVAEQVDASMSRLGLDRLHALLLHRPDQLLGSSGPALLRGLQRQKSEGRTSKIGLSIYGPDELGPLFALADFDIVQAPVNVLDDRMLTSGWAARLRDRGIEFHARSAFLQGLLLMARGNRPERFQRWDHLWQDWEEAVTQQEVTPLEACLHFVLRHPEIDRVVVGVDSLPQLREIVAAASGKSFTPPVWSGPVDPDLINPARWSQL